MLIRRIVLSVVLVIFLSSCATRPDKISPTYVSPLIYSSYSCKQIEMELHRVSRKVAEVTGQQNKTATKDAWAMGVGVVIFWPALFFMIGGDKKDELAHLKGEFDALEQAAIQKECEVADAIEAGRKEHEASEAEKKKQLEEKNQEIMNEEL